MASNKEWISVSDYARLIGRSTTHVYTLIAEGMVEYIPFNRGKNKGYLIAKPN